MTYEEAQAWLRGERSMCNLIPQDSFDTWQVRIAQADAAMTQTAYWVARYYDEVNKCTLRPRPSVRRFAELMEKKLTANDYKGGWSDMPVSELMDRLRMEVIEAEEFERVNNWSGVMNEVVDIANYAMMVAEVCGEELQKPSL